MKQRLPIVLSSAALVVAVMGATPIGHAARDVVAAVPPFAKNAGSVNGIKASKTPRAGQLLALGKTGKFPASVVPAGPRGPSGPQGPPGPAGTLSNVPAGGDLSGTYPNPSIRAGRVTTDALADNAVTGAKIPDNAISNSELQDNAVNGAKVSDRSLALADIAALNGTVTVDVPSVAANACVAQSVTISGRQGKDLLLLEPSTNFPTGLTLVPLYDTAGGDTFTVRVCNVTGGAIDAPAGDWGFAVFR